MSRVKALRKRVRDAEARKTDKERRLEPVRIVADNHPLDIAYRRGQLDGNKNAGPLRHAAGEIYREWYRISHSSGRDSTQGMSGSRGGMAPAFGEASRKLIATDSNLSAKDRKIVRMVCGDGHTPASAVLGTCGAAYERSVTPRFCEALDSLIDAMEAAQNMGWSFNGTA